MLYRVGKRIAKQIKFSSFSRYYAEGVTSRGLISVAYRLSNTAPKRRNSVEPLATLICSI